jgi:hypothetical protein
VGDEIITIDYLVLNMGRPHIDQNDGNRMDRDIGPFFWRV